jgi:hypothetical protein
MKKRKSKPIKKPPNPIPFGIEKAKKQMEWLDRK